MLRAAPSADGLSNCVCVNVQSSQYLLLCPAAGDGVLRRRFHHRSGEEHQRQHAEGGLDRLHLPRDPQGQSPFHSVSMTASNSESNIL